MSEINIAFTKEEMKLLLKLVYSGSFIVEIEEEESEDKINDLLQKILLTAKVNKAYRGIDFDQENNEYILSEKAEEDLLKEYDEFIEESFWEELLNRLGQRDFVKEVGEKEYWKMSGDTREQKQIEMEEKYREEFDRNGIKNLGILKE